MIEKVLIVTNVLMFVSAVWFYRKHRRSEAYIFILSTEMHFVADWLENAARTRQNSKKPIDNPASVYSKLLIRVAKALNGERIAN